MATSDFWQKVSSSASAPEWSSGATANGHHNAGGTSRLWMVLDVVTVLLAASLSTLFYFGIGPVVGVRAFWHGTLIEGRSMGLLLALLGGFMVALLLISRQLHLYTPARLNGFFA